MCDARTHPDEGDFGAIWVLCDDPSKHLLELVDPEITGLDRGPSRALVRAFVPPATVAVVEYDYFDLDYRSEFALTHETSFASYDPYVVRLHFFAVDARPVGDVRLRDFVRSSAEHYLGYATIRPHDQLVGRSLVTPKGTQPALAKPEGLERHVRTAVREQVTVFGVPLAATGVPFLEQDGRLLRCAQVSAWSCHYSAVLRGDVARRPTAQFHLVADPTGSYGRPYPSTGLTANAVSHILRNLDLPPEVIEQTDLGRKRTPTWHDRPGLRKAVAAVADDEDASDEDRATRAAARKRIWRAENLTATVCRYLNSGIPCILARGHVAHAQVVVGYLRRTDISEERRLEVEGHDTLSEVVAFLVQDDQAGPYQYVAVHELLREMSTGPANVSVIVPLPSGLWLSGSAAEAHGATLFTFTLEERLAALDDWANDLGLEPAETEAHRAELTRLLDAVRADPPEALAIRSFAASGTDYKLGLASRGVDETVQRAVGYTPLPKYVWVVEVHDRAKRGKEPSVVGTLVFDASAVPDVRRPTRSLSPMIVQIPGQVAQTYRSYVNDQEWQLTSLDSYKSGRWNHREDGTRVERQLARAKSAIASNR